MTPRRPPAINSVNVTAGQFGAIVTWTTDQLSGSKVEYGTDPSVLSTRVLWQTFTTQHSTVLQGLSPATTYYFRVSAFDAAGNVTTAPSMAPASFTTQPPSAPACPCSIWTDSQVPTLPSTADTSAVEVGVKFRPSTDGYVSAIRFYKGPLNTGVHVGNLWSSTGALLGSVTFMDESATGWQRAILANPIAVNANTTYVVSYHTSSGGYAADLLYFQNSGVTSGPLQALAEGVNGSNGLYRYGAAGFPDQSFNSTNYWVDVVFQTTLPSPPPPIVRVTDTAVSDFQSGTLDAGTYVAAFGNGEISLLPQFVEEFSGPSIPEGWTAAPWTAGGGVSLTGGLANLDGALLTFDSPLASGQSLEFVATFSVDAFQHGGLALTFNESLWAMFSTGYGGELLARTHDGVTPINTPLSSSWLGAPHRFRIDWTSSSVTFFIDGVEVAAHAQSIVGPMRPAFSDYNAGGNGLAIDSIRIGPYATAGTFTSRVVNGVSQVYWNTATSIVTVPGGTTLLLSVRFGGTAEPDGTWSSFVSIATGTSAISNTSRYLQYRVELTGAGTHTPTLESISFRGSEVK